MTEWRVPPWRESGGPSVLSDIEILRKMAEQGVLSVHTLSEGRRSKSQIRLQCRYLRKLGLVERMGSELYGLTASGERVIDGSREMPQSNGYFDLQTLLDLSDNRITDLSLLTQEDIKQINFDIYREVKNPDEETAHEYSVDVRDARRKSREVLSAKRWKLDRILREFPRTEPITSQCAHWVASLVSFHLFPDANHRTAMIALYRLALANEVVGEDHRWPGDKTEIGKAVLLSKFHRHLSPERNFERLWRRDTLYWHWFQYFESLLFGVEYPALNHHSEKALRKKLQRVRDE
ncbi:Fic family protein [Halosimplex pelagicum]|uniref:Fic family protein n=1 Tax=Halosimplex pelagicum TaxID=869886 RepID=A0A7D5SYE0_9EURY|nr:Fic family protein [Halosimplex pelagicum]QLH84747.1 Fic family protein [Halosimplex pelagicum]